MNRVFVWWTAASTLVGLSACTPVPSATNISDGSEGTSEPGDGDAATAMVGTGTSAEAGGVDSATTTAGTGVETIGETTGGTETGDTGPLGTDCPIPPTPAAVVDRPALVVSGPGNFWQVSEVLPPGGGAVTVTVTATELQAWLGFGGTFNEAGWDVLSELTPDERARAMRLLFSPSEGANFAWGRIPMGASDYSMDRYTLNDTPGDYAMESFSIDRDRMRLIPFIKAAQAEKPDIRFWASPWTPPPWMKTVQEYNGTNLLPDGSNEATAWTAFMLDDPQTLGAYALYFARFIEAYEDECIPIEHVQPQNEPGYSTRYPSCDWAPGLLGAFVGEYLQPTLQARGLQTEIWFGTLSNPDTYEDHVGGLTGLAAAATVGVGLQWNPIDRVGELVDQGYVVMQTEHRCGNYPWLDTIAANEATADRNSFLPGRAPNNHNYGVETWDLIQQWLEAGVHSYSAWNMVLDTEGQNLDAERPWPQNSLLVVDRDSDTLIATPAYYVFRHLSYFVDPGAVRLDTTGGNALAFRNPDGSLIAVVHNAGQGAASINVALGGTTVQVQVPGQGWATINFEG